MKLLMGIAFMFLLAGNAATLTDLRNLYVQAASSKQSCKQLLDICNGNEGLPKNIMLGYKGSATMMMAKHVFNPVTKLSNFSDGKKLMEQAVALDTNSVEVRFLRYAVQANAPAFLGYNNSIVADKMFLQKNYKNVGDIALKKMVEDFLVGKK